VEVRARSLRQIHQLWTEADTERDRLASWLAGVERMLRNARNSIRLRVSILVLSRLKGSDCGLIWLSWIRIRILIRNADPDRGVRKFTKINKDPEFQPFKKAVVT
jgi:hypothetical protein